MAKQVRKTPQEATSKWVEKLGAAGPEMEAGVRRVTEAPGQAAVAQAAKWKQRLAESEPKWKANTGKVGLAEWQNSMITIGVPRVASGAQQKQGKVQAFNSEFYPFLDQVLQKVNAMPTTTPGQRVAKMVATVEAIKGFKRTGAAPA